MEAASLDDSLTDEERNELLDKFALMLAESRTQAIRGREESGIEKDWIEDEEFYEGIDEYNRGESTWSSKPAGRAGLQTVRPTGSTIFVNVTRPYCDAGSARIGDMLAPTDDKAFAITNTPIPELSQIVEGKIPKPIQAQIKAEAPGREEQVTSQLVDELTQKLEDAKEKAKKAEKRIEDWLIECQYHSHVRSAIDDAGKAGSGVLKGPVPERRETIAFKDGRLILDSKTIPVTRRISYWNLFPDPSCGEDIHRGSFIWERDDITEKEVQDLIGKGYLDEQLYKVLEEKPHAAFKEWKLGHGSDHLGLQRRKTDNLYEIWYGYRRVTKEQAELSGLKLDKEFIDVQVTMINNHVIKLVENHLDTGGFPYDIMIWQKRADSPWGIGIARQMRPSQKMVNAATRNLMDNAGLGGGPMWILLQGLVEPIDGVWELAPRKGWYAGEDAAVDDVRKAFSFVEFPIVQEQLQAIIDMALRRAEETTGLPMLLQGQQGSAPETVGGMAMLFNSASSVLRRLARNFDDRVTEPHIRRYYAYLLQYGEDDEKGDFQVDARGSSALVERALQSQYILQMGNLVTNPVFKIDPKKWRDEMLKSWHLDPKSFDYDDEDWKQLVQQITQPQQADPRVEVEAMRQEGRANELQFKADMDQQKQEFQAQLLQATQEFQMLMKQIEAENDQLKEAGKQELSWAQIEVRMKEVLDKHKVELAKNAQNLQMENRKLEAQVAMNDREVITPPIEPAQRAKPGHSFED